MFKLIGWLIKTSAFALVVIVAANYFKVGNRTVSDQIRTSLSHAENAADMTGVPSEARHLKGDLQGWAREITSDQNEGSLKKEKAAKEMARKMKSRAQAHGHRAVKIVSEEIPSSERQKLRALMRELNSSRASE